MTVINETEYINKSESKVACWFCNSSGGEMEVTLEFDSVFHTTCLAEELKNGNEEAEIIAREIGLDGLCNDGLTKEVLGSSSVENSEEGLNSNTLEDKNLLALEYDAPTLRPVWLKNRFRDTK